MKNKPVKENQKTERHSRPQNARPTIGMLGSDMTDCLLQWLGTVDAIRQRDVNFISWLGGRLRDPEGFQAQGNVLFDLVAAENIDGLMLSSGNLSIPVSPEETREFCLSLIHI